MLVRSFMVCTPLRQPVVLARGASTLDLLTSGRVELGLGAGGVWEGITSVGVPRLGPGESLAALEETIAVLRALWGGGADRREAMVGHYESVSRTLHETAPEAGWGAPIDLPGSHHSLHQAYPGPRPTHRIPVYIGAHGPRALRLTGRVADGIALSHGRMTRDGYLAAQRTIDWAPSGTGRTRGASPPARAGASRRRGRRSSRQGDHLPGLSPAHAATRCRAGHGARPPDLDRRPCESVQVRPRRRVPARPGEVSDPSPAR